MSSTSGSSIVSPVNSSSSSKTSSETKREENRTTFRNWISASGNTPFVPETGRYHLYISYACPWAQRTLIVRNLKGLENFITVDIVHPLLDRQISWSFDKSFPGTTGDTVGDRKTIKEVYLSADPNYSGIFTVPALYDKHLRTIVNNESSEIIRMFNSECNAFSKNPDVDIYPEHMRSKIEEMTAWITSNIISCFYKCAFAKTQEDYDVAYQNLFCALDRVEEILARSRFVCGPKITESDVLLFVSLVRFDFVNYTYFKVNLKRIVDYPNTWNYLKELYQMKAFGDTVDFNHINVSQFSYRLQADLKGMTTLNPCIYFAEPHSRNEQVPL